MHFRYYCLNEEDRIVLGDNLMAPDLDSAIRAAYEACRDHPHFPSSRIEIWPVQRAFIRAGMPVRDPTPERTICVSRVHLRPFAIKPSSLAFFLGHCAK